MINLARRCGLLACTAALIRLYGQEPGFESGSVLGVQRLGLRLYDASVSGGYYSNGYGLGPSSSSYGAGLGNGLGSVSASASVGWQGSRPGTSFSLLYQPNVTQTAGGSSYRSFNHSASFTINQQVAPKWVLALSARGLLADFNQLLFVGSQRDEALSGATFDVFANAILRGQSGGDPNLLATAPVPVTPDAAYFYGRRELSAGGQVSLSYAATPRSIFTGSVYGLRMQSVNGGAADASGIVGPSAIIPSTTAVTGSLSWSYAISPRTTTNVNLISARTISRYQDIYSSRAQWVVGRTMSLRWFVQAMVGGGYITPVRETIPYPHHPQPEFGGTLGFKTPAHTFTGAYARMSADTYGLASRSSDSTTAGWAWHRPGRSVAVNASFSYSRLAGSIFENASSWSGRGALAKRLNRQTSLKLMYSYVTYPQSILGLALGNSLAQSGVMVTLAWEPSPAH
jgi:hypothetical protein